jgi:hypothetical protein
LVDSGERDFGRRDGGRLSGFATAGSTPTAEQAGGAGQVCTSAATVKKDAQGLASAATSGGDVEAKLTAQLAVIKASANTLATTITAVPVGSERDLGLAAVKTSADRFTASVTALEASVNALKGKSGLSKAKGLATLADAASTSLANLGATTQAIKAAAKDGKTALEQAFATAPSCASLNSE